MRRRRRRRTALIKSNNPHLAGGEELSMGGSTGLDPLLKKNNGTIHHLWIMFGWKSSLFAISI